MTENPPIIKFAPAGVIEFRLWHLTWIAERMRADEIRQYEALIGTFSPDAATLTLGSRPGVRFTLTSDDGMPLVCGGFTENFAGVHDSWMAGTDQAWRDHWVSITKASRWLMDSLFATGALRIQLAALADRDEKTFEWYRKGLKMKCEGVVKAGGIYGSDVVIYSRMKEQDHGQQR